MIWNLCYFNILLPSSLSRYLCLICSNSWFQTHFLLLTCVQINPIHYTWTQAYRSIANLWKNPKKCVASTELKSKTRLQQIWNNYKIMYMPSINKREKSFNELLILQNLEGILYYHPIEATEGIILVQNKSNSSPAHTGQLLCGLCQYSCSKSAFPWHSLPQTTCPCL